MAPLKDAAVRPTQFHAALKRARMHRLPCALRLQILSCALPLSGRRCLLTLATACRTHGFVMALRRAVKAVSRTLGALRRALRALKALQRGGRHCVAWPPLLPAAARDARRLAL